ncbi:MAG: protein kinase [Actinomycetota bacterium]
MLEKNTILQDRYQIIRQLGHGGMGTVYEAKDAKRFGKLVALKEILFDLKVTSNPKEQKVVRRAFEREAKILTQLEHEAFPQVIDYFVEDDRQFLVMELIQGKDLGELLKKRKTPFELEDILKWADQLLDALDYLHTLAPPTIHRDIKPQNLKLNSRGKIKLLDFGIAKGIDLQSNMTITNQTFVAATLHYSPFEQIFRVLDPSFQDALKPFYGEQMAAIAKQTADARSDIYALGATLYHLMTMQLPFDSLKRTLEIWAGNADPLPNPQVINPNIPSEISDWLLKAIEVARENRFESAEEMQTELREAMNGEKIREESTRKLKWLREQEILRLEREALTAERKKLEAERLRYAELDNQPLNDAQTLRDLVEPLEKTDEKSYETNISFSKSVITQPSATKSSIKKANKSVKKTKKVVEKADELPEYTAVADEKPSDFTATSYLLGVDLGDKEIAPQHEETVKQSVPPPTAVKAVWLFPLVIGAFILSGGMVWGILWLAGLAQIPETGVNADKSITTRTSVVTETSPNPTPEIIPTLTPETVNANQSESNTSFGAIAPDQSESDTSLSTVETPTERISQNKSTLNPETPRLTPPAARQIPQPQMVNKMRSQPTKTRSPKTNPDCIFNNDCK